MTLKKIEDLKAWIVQQYPELNPRKFEAVKIGKNVYVYYVGKDGNLHREVVFRGSLPTVEGLPILQEQLAKKVDAFVKKWIN